MSRRIAGPDPLAEAPEQVLAPEHQELLYLRQFFYQCPAGLFETDDAGIVRMVNPAAVRLLAPIIGDGDLSQLFPLLRRVAPEMVDVITRDPGQLGPLAAGRRMLIPAGADRDAWLEMQAVRVAPGRVMIVVQDVSAERRLAIREHQTAVELQLTMLGHADDIPGLATGVTYRAAAAELQVGGDWYDVIGLDDGRAMFVVGDAVGHNLSATTAMGQLRSAIAATAPYVPDPAALLTRADVLAGQISGAECATVACVLLDPATGQLSYATAGHPPILVVHAGGGTTYLDGGRGLPLGVARATRRRATRDSATQDSATQDSATQIAATQNANRSSAMTQLAPGDLLVLYTDGLYERRREAPDVGLARLARLAAEARGLPPSELSHALADGMLAGAAPEDDICVLVAAPELAVR
jgi:serine phosphatase RsbU (regulator of sigma subunit)